MFNFLYLQWPQLFPVKNYKLTQEDILGFLPKSFVLLINHELFNAQALYFSKSLLQSSAKLRHRLQRPPSSLLL